jgi:hypothetical protein
MKLLFFFQKVWGLLNAKTLITQKGIRVKPMNIIEHIYFTFPIKTK